MSVFKLQFLWLLVILMLWIFSILKTRKTHTHTDTQCITWFWSQSRWWVSKQDKQRIWVLQQTEHPTHTEMPDGCSRTLFFLFCLFVCFLNSLMDDDLSHWLRLTCLWVILTMTEGGRGVDIWCISLTLSWWWMEWSSSPCRRPYSTAMLNDKLHTCLSLFNEHQVPSVWCVCLCARVRAYMQGSGREIAKKIG